MTQALALTMLQTGIPSMLPAGRALPEFDMAMAIGPTLMPISVPTLTPASAPVTAAAVPDIAVDNPSQNASAGMPLARVTTGKPGLTPVLAPLVIAAIPNAAVDTPVQYAPAKTTLTQVTTAKSVLAVNIPADAPQLMLETEATGEAVSPETPVTPFIPRTVIRSKIADAVTTKAAIAEPQPERATLPEEKTSKESAEREIMQVNEDEELGNTESTVAKPEYAPVPAMPAPGFIALPVAEKSPAPTLFRAGSTRARAANTKIDDGIAVTHSRAKSSEARLDRQSVSVEAAALPEEDAPATVAQPAAVPSAIVTTPQIPEQL